MSWVSHSKSLSITPPRILLVTIVRILFWNYLVLYDICTFHVTEYIYGLLIAEDFIYVVKKRTSKITYIYMMRFFLSVAACVRVYVCVYVLLLLLMKLNTYHAAFIVTNINVHPSFCGMTIWVNVLPLKSIKNII